MDAEGVMTQPYSRNDRRWEHGPNIVAIGGGTGLSTMLRGLKGYTKNLTAIVAVTDDGGSSGMLRQELGISRIVAMSFCEPRSCLPYLSS